MRHSSFRLSIATLLVIGGCAGALAFVSTSNAGSTGATLKFFAHPQALGVNGTGFVKAAYTAASGSGTGSATHVVITVTLPTGLVFDASHSSTGCSIADAVNHPNDVVCNVGTVNAGTTATRFVTFTATTAGSKTINGNATQDNGTGGSGGGGGSVNTPIFADPAGQLTVYPSTDTSNNGNCFFNGGSVQTPNPTGSDIQSTGASVGKPDPSLGIPCAYADVGETAITNFADKGFNVPAISHDNIAILTGPATITIKLDPLPVSFNKIVWRYFPTFDPASPPTNVSQGTIIGPCTNDGKLPTDKDVCLLLQVKSGNSGTWTFLQNGTGSDPGYGS
jgi:hypothetical protein